MSSMSNTRKDIAERLGFAANNGAKAAFAQPNNDRAYAAILKQAAKVALDAWKLAVQKEEEYLEGANATSPFFVNTTKQRELKTRTQSAYELAKRLNPDYQGFARSGAKARFADNDAALSKFLVKYKDNENNNYHSENVVLLANFVGSSSEIAQAKDILKKVRAAGHLPPDLNDEQYSLYKSLAAKLKSKYPGAKFSRPGAKAKFGGHDAFVVTQNYNGSATGTIKGFDSLQQAQAYIKERRAAIAAKATPEEAKTVSWTIYKTIDEAGNSQSIGTVKFARSGAKATMGMKLVKTFPTSSQNRSAKIYRDSDYNAYLVKFYDNGKYNANADYETDDLQDAIGTAEYSINRVYASRPGAKTEFAITKEQIRGASREELRSIEQRLMALAKSGDKNAAALLDYIEEEYNDRYRGTHSRPGAKAKFEISSYEQAEYQIALTEERIVSYRKTLANTEAMIRHANSLMRTADSGDKKAMKEVIGIARMLESTMKSRGFSRPGAKTTMAKPPRKYEHGDRVYIMNGNERVGSGVIDYIFDYDDFVKTYIYKVRDEGGGRRSYNETSLKKMSRPGAKAKMGMEEDYYSRGVRAAQMSGLVPDFKTGVQDSPWFQLGYKMGEKYGLKASGMIKSAPSEFPKIAARIAPVYRMK